MPLLNALLVHILTCTVLALDLPPGIPIVSTTTPNITVSYDTVSSVFRYSYVVVNSPDSKGSILEFNIDVSTQTGGDTFSAVALANSATGYLLLLSTTALALNGQAMIPVGIATQPPHWLSSLSSDGFISWFGPDVEIAPGASAGPFVLMSHAPPGIRRFVAEPPYDPNDFLPSIDDTSLSDAQSSQIGPMNTAIQAAIIFHGFTVGPDDPPALSAGDAITRLATLKHQSVDQGWIGGHDFIEDLDERLDEAKKALAQNKPFKARKTLQQFIKELEEQRREQMERGDHNNGEREKQHDRGGKELEKERENSEPFIKGNAFFLLKPNAELIISKLPAPPDEDREDERPDRSSLDRR